MQTHTGTVKWFDKRRGYGFVIPDGNGHPHLDVMIHIKTLKYVGDKKSAKVNDGQRVEYELDIHHLRPRAAKWSFA